MSEQISVFEAGLAASWACQARLVPRSTTRHLGGLMVVLSGVRDQTQQVAVVEGAVPDPAAAVIAAEVLFDRAGWRPAFDLVAGAHPDIEAVLADRGFEVVVARPGMIRHLEAGDWAPREAPVHIELGVSRDRNQMIEVQREAFGLDPETARGLFPNAMFRDPSVAVVVARPPEGNAIVGSVTVHLRRRIGALIGLAVKPECRGQGIGSALVAAVLDLARSHAVETIWLQATPEGTGIYERAGFVEVGSCEVWLR